MTQQTGKSMHQLAEGTGVLWALRGLLTKSRDVPLTPEDGVFESANAVETSKAEHGPLRKARKRERKWITPNQTYRGCGQLSEVYVQNLGVRLAIRG